MRLATKILILFVILAISLKLTNAREVVEVIEYAEVPGGFPCGDVNAESGKIQSLNYPNDYPNYEDCIWKITTPSGSIVTLEFETPFDIENSQVSCSYDYLEIRDGRAATSPLLGEKLCGTTVPNTIKSTGNTMFVKFHSDGSSTRKGFSASFNMPNLIEGPTHTGLCQRVKVMATLTSDSYHSYRESEECARSAGAYDGIYKISPKKVMDHHVYENEQESWKWIAMCTGFYICRTPAYPWVCPGWCIGAAEIETSNLVLFESGSTANEPWQAEFFKNISYNKCRARVTCV